MSFICQQQAKRCVQKRQHGSQILWCAGEKRKPTFHAVPLQSKVTSYGANNYLSCIPVTSRCHPPPSPSILKVVWAIRSIFDCLN